MRVLYVEGAYGFGGSLTGLLHLFDGLPADVTPILVTCFDPTPFVDLPDDLIHHRVHVPAVPQRHGHWAIGLLRYARQNLIPWHCALQPLVRRYQPTVIHANNSLVSNYAVGYVGRRANVPTISHQKGFEYLGRFNRWLAKNSPFDHHVATSGAIARHLLSLGIPEHRLSTVYEPVIGPDSDKPCVITDRNHVPTLAMHSMLVPEKGQHVFLNAIAMLRNRNVPSFRVRIAGSSPAGERDYVDLLHRQMHRLNLKDCVTFCGHHRDVYSFLATCDVAIHAAVEPEPFGRVVAEAMLCGLATIVTADGGPAEYVRHGETGFCVPRGDAGALADALEPLIRSPALRRHVGLAARRYARSAFDPQSLTRRLVEVYRQVCEPVASANYAGQSG